MNLNSDGSFDFTGPGGTWGSERFWYSACDASNIGVEAEVLLIQNIPPVVIFDEYIVNADTMLTVAAPGVLANDTDSNGDTMVVSLVTDAVNGTLNLNADGSFTYDPTPGYRGLDTFTYSVFDGWDSNEVTVALTVVNTPPTVGGDEYETTRDVMLSVAAPGVLVSCRELDVSRS